LLLPTSDAFSVTLPPCVLPTDTSQ
jgi:hypothetical protein